MNSGNKSKYEGAKPTTETSKDFRLRYTKALLSIFYLLLLEFIYAIARFFKPPKPKNVSGQLVLVTGGANGLGKCIALKFAEHGCNIAVADLLSTEDTVLEITEKFGVKCKGFHCDVADSRAIHKLKEEIESSLGPVDILVNNAGIMYSKPLVQSSDEDIEKCFAINTIAHFKTVKTFLPGMIERRQGSIIAIASILAKTTLPLSTVYSSTKYGVEGFMDALFDEICVKDYDEFIKLTTVYPVFIVTRKDVIDMLDNINANFIRLTPEFVAQKIIQSVLREERKVFLNPGMPCFINYLPERVQKHIKTTDSNIKKVFENDYSQC